MGMFDNITCDYPLPDGFSDPRYKLFQTKNLDCELAGYLITAEGLLLRTSGGCYSGSEVLDPPEHVSDYHGRLYFYTGNFGSSGGGYVATHDDEPPWHRTYIATFTEGRLTAIEGGVIPEQSAGKHVSRAQFAEVAHKAHDEQIAKQHAEWHGKAMELAVQADLETHKPAALELFLDAAELENKIAKQIHIEPSRSVFYRSAASLYISAGRDWAALGVIRDWMAHPSRKNAPAEIAAEIAEVLHGIADRIEKAVAVESKSEVEP